MFYVSSSRFYVSESREFSLTPPECLYDVVSIHASLHVGTQSLPQSDKLAYCLFSSESCNSAQGYKPVCDCGGAFIANCMDNLNPASCTCYKEPECGESSDCAYNAGSHGGGYPSLTCFDCTSQVCSYASEGTYCGVHYGYCQSNPGSLLCWYYSSNLLGGCSGSYCTCWEKMDCESDARRGQCNNILGGELEHTTLVV
jgi:hypothetical protein